MDKMQLQSRMRELLREYQELKLQLDELLRADALVKFKKEQQAALEEFKKLYTVEIGVDDNIVPINWDSVEKSILSDENVRLSNQEGAQLCYNEIGMAGLATISYDSTTFTPYAADQVDAERYIAREKRRQEFLGKNKRERSR